MLPVVGAQKPGRKRKKRGIYADPAGTPKGDLEDKVADFSYQNDALAQLIVDMWAGAPVTNLITPSGAGTTQSEYQQRSAAQKQLSRLGASIWSNPS